MAKFNELLASRFAEGISSLLGLSEQPGVSTVSPELMPVLMAEGERAEHSFLKQERLAWGSGSAAADVAQFSYISFVNPAGSGMIMTIEKMWVEAVGVPGLFRFGVILAAQLAALSAMVAGFAQARDLRWGVLNGTVMGLVRMGSGTNGTLGVNPDIEIRLANGEMREFEVDIVIPPGCGVAFTAAQINTAVRASYVWRERAMLPEENA